MCAILSKSTFAAMPFSQVYFELKCTLSALLLNVTCQHWQENNPLCEPTSGTSEQKNHRLPNIVHHQSKEMPNRDRNQRHAEELDASMCAVMTPADVISDLKTKFENDPNNDETRFLYACALSRSGGKHAEDDKRAAVSHFAHLVQNGVHIRDSLYNLALTEYVLADYEFARVHCEDLYRQDPDNKQVKKLHAAIAYKHKRMLEQQKSDRDTTIGVALGVGLGIAAVGLGFLLAGGKRGNK